MFALAVYFPLRILSLQALLQQLLLRTASGGYCHSSYIIHFLTQHVCGGQKRVGGTRTWGFGSVMYVCFLGGFLPANG